MAIKMKKLVTSFISTLGNSNNHQAAKVKEQLQESVDKTASDTNDNIDHSPADSGEKPTTPQQKITYPPDHKDSRQPRRTVASYRRVTPVAGNIACRRYLVLNGKGGCGKTTISTNLASYFAVKGYKTAIMDHDPQESSITWLKLRQSHNADAAKISGIAAHPDSGGLVTRSWQLRTPPGTERVIVDAPAGTSGAELIEILKNVHAIVIPVLPSSIDMHATARFIQDLLLVGKVRQRNIPVGIVANRVPRQTTAYKKLLMFLSALNIPFVVKFKDNQHYLNAAESGLGIHELNSGNSTSYEISQWDRLVEWLETAGKPQ